MPHVDWRLEAIDVTTCNCDFSCPCQFNAPPTHGDCRAAVGFFVEKGHFGDTPLDGVKFAVLFAWPGAIHEGRGQAQIILDEATSEDQRKAMVALVKGEETEPGATIFNVFSNVIDTYHEPIAAPVEIACDIDARTAQISVPGILEATGEPIRNPRNTPAAPSGPRPPRSHSAGPRAMPIWPASPGPRRGWWPEGPSGLRLLASGEW
jgi:hypothetical protein